MSSPILKRLTSNSIKDASAVPGQGMPLICLVTISKSNQPSYYLSDGTTYSRLNDSYAGNTLVFNTHGSLTDIHDLTSFYVSPFDPSYPNITPPVPQQSMDVINGSDNSFVYGLIGNFSTPDPLISGSQTYVSPNNSKWVLNVSFDNAGNRVYKIFFNPLQNPNLSQADIGSNLSRLCDVISNADPMCFCDSSNNICTKAAFTNNDDSSLSSTNKTDVQSNCSCLNNQCRFAMISQNNQYVKQFNCGSTSACGKTFKYDPKYGISSTDANSTVFTACGGVDPSGGAVPSSGSGGSGGGGSGGTGGKGGADAKKSGMSTTAKVALVAAIVLLIMAITYVV
jgi:hypothetical protein